MNRTGLVLDGITVRYGGEPILDNVSLAVSEGQRLIITGPNGAGKTTLLDVITGTRHPDQGQVLWNGRDITNMPTHRRARLGIARLWQYPALCDSLTVVENLSIAVHTQPNVQRRTSVDAALLEAGLEDLKHRAAKHLSTGQRRRVEITAAALRHPRLLLLDEPGAGLDETAHARTVDQFHRLCPTTSMIVAEHNIDAATQLAGCDRLGHSTPYSSHDVGTGPGDRATVRTMWRVLP